MTDKSGMLAAVATAAGLDAATPVAINADFIATHFPDAAAALRAEGIKAEASRLASIEDQAVPGYDKIIAAMKADTSKTGADAAMAIIAAQKKERAAMMASLSADEEKVKGLRSQPSNGVTDPATDSGNAISGLKGEALWKAEYDRSEKLQGEFASQSEYLALKRAESSGLVKRLKDRKAA